MANEPFKPVKKEVIISDAWNDLNHHLVLGITTRLEGYSKGDFSSLNLGLHVNDNRATVIKNREKVGNVLGFPIQNWVCADQVHETSIETIHDDHKGKGVFSYEDAIEATDGLYTKNPNILLTAAFADCVPLYFHVKNTTIIGIAHAGWKGTTSKIAAKMVQTLSANEKVVPEDISVLIGPAIGKCCYEVDEKVVSAAKNSCKAASVAYTSTSPLKYNLDLKELNKQILLEAGVNGNNIMISSLCTSCNNDYFFSHRKDQNKTGRMLAFIGLKQED